MIDQLLTVVKRASAAIMEVYDTNSAVVETKADNSPLTQADKASHVIITTALKKRFCFSDYRNIRLGQEELLPGIVSVLTFTVR
jgi:3'-phosphoadenosine 5'-phosphosulfate (PAPS) 3'-phosphatase